jgi:dTDP-4-amino-4,6-dideoxygalactose transaminase
MNVPMYDHAALYRAQRSQIDAAFRRVLESGKLDWGPEVPAFEGEFAAWLGIEHAVGTNSGTSALKVALLALGIGPGDEVITVPNSDIGTVAAIHHTGARAVWVDVEPDTLNLDPALVADAITPRTKALLPVHLYGHPADMPALAAIAAEHGLHIVADACLALGAEIAGRNAGAWGDAAAFSFAPSKHLGGYGTGGMVVTADPRLAERMRRIGAYGQARERHYARDPGQGLDNTEEGLNERLDEIQAALLRTKLGALHDAIEGRRAHAHSYREGLAGAALTLPPERAGCRHSYRNYVVQVDNRARVQAQLADAGIASSRPYAPPLHLQPVYRELGFGPGSFPVAERSAERLLSLPIRPDLRGAQVGHVVATLRQAVA